MSTLERAIEIAARAHAGQVDKAGQPYVLHPLRVMLRVAGPEERIVAVLHDVLEDSDVTAAALREEGFSEAVLAALESVSRRPGEDYEAFVRRAGMNRIGRRVKLADLADNSDPSRIPAPTEQDRARFEKYRRALEILRALDPDGALA